MILTGTATVYLLIFVFSLFFLSVWKLFHERGNLPPGPVPLPIIGNLHQMKISDMVQSLKLLSNKYGPVFTIHLGFRRVVMIWGYDAVKEALVDQGEVFGGRGPLPTFDTVLKDFGVNLNNGPSWKECRRFSLSTLRNYGMGKRNIEERIQEEAQYLMEGLRNTKELPFDPTLHISNAVSNVTCAVLFGKRFDYQDKDFLELLGMINESFVLTSSLCGQLYNMFTSVMEYLPGPHRKIYQCLTDLERFVEKRVKINQETLDVNSPRDFIDCFLIQMEKDKDKPSSEYYMKNLVITVLGIFIAGTETVGTTIRHALLIFLKYPDIEEKVLAEIDSVIGQNRMPAIEDRNKMPYTDAVIHEIQRFSDLVPLGVPHMVLEDTKFRGFTLPKGTEVYTILSSVLRDPTKFTEPENFNPGHFLDENGKFKKNDAFMPFSAGKRICVGESMGRMELFIYITTILQNFKLKSPDLKEIDVKPILSGFLSIPMHYKLQVIPR